jgi:hypothetical protein
MGRNKIKRTASQEAVHQAEIKEKKAERSRKRRAEQTREQKDAVKEKQKKAS